jgi:hypothetical protein
LYRRHPDDGGLAVDLNHRLVDGGCAVEGGGRADDAVASDHSGFDYLPAAKRHDQRNGTGQGKIDAVDLAPGFKKHRRMPEFDAPQMRRKQLEVRV